MAYNSEMDSSIEASNSPTRGRGLEDSCSSDDNDGCDADTNTNEHVRSEWRKSHRRLLAKFPPEQICKYFYVSRFILLCLFIGCVSTVSMPFDWLCIDCIAASCTSGCENHRDESYITEKIMPPPRNHSLAVPQAQKLAQTGTRIIARLWSRAYTYNSALNFPVH
jgi:hypothetical protein